MATTSASVLVPLGQARAFEMLADVARFDEWLVFHGGWCADAPSRDALRPGLSIASILAVKGATAPFEWVVDAYRPPSVFAFSGKEKGVKATVVLRAEPASEGAEVTFQLGLSGLPMTGPVGKVVVKSLSGDVEASMQRFRAMAGGQS